MQHGLIGIQGIPVKPDGTCGYLNDEGNGCGVYGSPLRPQLCIDFTCLDILAKCYAERDTNPFTAVIVAAARLEARLEHEYNLKQKDKKEKDKNGRDETM
jgi:hypothetical protein